MSDIVLDLVRRVVDLERRLENMVRKVRVKSYDGGKVIVEDDTGFVSARIPQASMSSSGDWKIDAPAPQGAQGLMLSDGDPANGTFIPCLPSDANPHASAELGTWKLMGPNGESITIAGGELTVEASHILIRGDVDIEGGYVKSNGHHIDDTHKHVEVMPGPDLTGVPA